MNGPWSKSMGAFGAGNEGVALRLKRCAKLSLKRSMETIGAVSGFLATRASAAAAPVSFGVVAPASFGLALLLLLHAATSNAKAALRVHVHTSDLLESHARTRRAG